ncbi:MAG TPA: TraM recognition domain-containing protein, partial [Abditibacterium sp.]
LRQGRPLCVFDLRGDLIDRILVRIAAQGEVEEWKKRLLLLDLRSSDSFVGANPLAGEGDTYSRAMHLLSVLKAQSESWGIQLEESLRNSLIALAETGWTPLEIDPLFTDAKWRAQVMHGVKDAQVRSFFARYDKLSEASRTTWALAALNKVSPLLSVPTLRYTFGQRQPLPFRELIERNKGMVILVSLAVDRFHDAARLAGGLLVSCFQSAIMSRSDVPENKRTAVNLYIDEFEAMASDRFETIVAEGRRLGLGLSLSHQNLSQIPNSLRSVILNNAHTQFYFQTGAKDAAELAREIGGECPTEEARAALLSQQVGQAFLVRRGQDTAQVQVEHSPDPGVSRAQVEALKAASAATYARSRQQIEAELETRIKERQGNVSSPTDEVESSRPVYEIRHSKTKTFAPKPKGGDQGKA